MPGYSIRDQYCNLNTGTWQETVYLGSEDCTKEWWQWQVRRQTLVFASDGCINGLQVQSCAPGSCAESPTAT